MVMAARGAQAASWCGAASAARGVAAWLRACSAGSSRRVAGAGGRRSPVSTASAPRTAITAVTSWPPPRRAGPPITSQTMPHAPPGRASRRHGCAWNAGMGLHGRGSCRAASQRGTTKVDFSRPTAAGASGCRPRGARSSNSIGVRAGARLPPPPRAARAPPPSPSAPRPERPAIIGARHRCAMPGRPLHRDAVALRLLGGVHDLQAVDVLDLAVVDQARQRRRGRAPRRPGTALRSARLVDQGAATISSRMAV